MRQYITLHTSSLLAGYITERQGERERERKKVRDIECVRERQRERL